jgi:hypothetical protein
VDAEPHISNDRTVTLWLTALVLLAAVAGGDFATGYEADFFAFYFVPVWLLGRYSGLHSGIAIGMLAAIIWFLVDRASGDPHALAVIGYWNGAVVLAAYLAIAVAASSLRKKTIAVERLTAQLSEAHEQIDRLEKTLPAHHFVAKEPASSSLRLA